MHRHPFTVSTLRRMLRCMRRHKQLFGTCDICDDIRRFQQLWRYRWMP